MKHSNFNIYKQGIRHGVPIFLGYIAVSFTLGIVARNAGISTFQATLMSFTNLTSAGEFAAVTLIGASATYLEMAVTQFIINLRYMLMSCALSQKLPPETTTLQRLLIGFGVTDEVFGMEITYPGALNPYYAFGLISIVVPGWTFGTCMGVMLGNVLPANIVTALSVALYGMFISIIVPPARHNKVVGGIVIISMAASLLFAKLPVLSNISSGMRIIILTVIIAGIAAVLFPHDDEDEPNTQNTEDESVV